MPAGGNGELIALMIGEFHLSFPAIFSQHHCDKTRAVISTSAVASGAATLARPAAWAMLLRFLNPLRKFGSLMVGELHFQFRVSSEFIPAASRTTAAINTLR